MKRKMVLLLTIVTLAAFVGSASAQPAGQYRLVFVTSEMHNAVSTDINVYNDWIQSLATAAGLPGNDWRVIGSTDDVDARDNTGTNPTVETGVPIYLVDGITKVADDNADLWDGDVDHVIDMTETGGDPAHLWCFTGTLLDGTQGGSQFGPLGRNVNGKVTQAAGMNVDTWIFRTWTGQPTTAELPFYGMSEVLPEPATMVLLGLGGLGLFRRRRNR